MLRLDHTDIQYLPLVTHSLSLIANLPDYHFLLALAGGPQGEAAGVFHSIPLQRAGNKTEMAHGVLFLASRVSSFVTGAVLVMDGGAWLTTANDVAQMLGIAYNSAKL